MSRGRKRHTRKIRRHTSLRLRGGASSRHRLTAGRTGAVHKKRMASLSDAAKRRKGRA